MIAIKSDKEIESMRRGGKILARVLRETMAEVKPGISELEVNDFAEKWIRELGGEPGFQKVKGYHHAICVATNEVVVHGIPTDRAFKEGDVVCIDCGVFYQGLHTDMADTIQIKDQKARLHLPVAKATGGQAKSKNEQNERFLAVGKKALEAAIAQATSGNRVGHISQAIQKIVEGGGYSVVRNLVGHGVGYELHEEPEVPGFLEGSVAKTPLLQPGMTVAIEVIYNMGKPDVVYASNDGWTIKTADNRLSAVFERTVLITKGDPEILTA